MTVLAAVAVTPARGVAVASEEVDVALAAVVSVDAVVVLAAVVSVYVVVELAVLVAVASEPLATVEVSVVSVVAVFEASVVELAVVSAATLCVTGPAMSKPTKTEAAPCLNFLMLNRCLLFSVLYFTKKPNFLIFLKIHTIISLFPTLVKYLDLCFFVKINKKTVFRVEIKEDCFHISFL